MSRRTKEAGRAVRRRKGHPAESLNARATSGVLFHEAGAVPTWRGDPPSLTPPVGTDHRERRPVAEARYERPEPPPHPSSAGGRDDPTPQKTARARAATRAAPHHDADQAVKAGEGPDRPASAWCARRGPRPSGGRAADTAGARPAQHEANHRGARGTDGARCTEGSGITTRRRATKWRRRDAERGHDVECRTQRRGGLPEGGAEETRTHTT